MIASEGVRERIEVVEKERTGNRHGEREFTGEYTLVKKVAAREMFVTGKEENINSRNTATRTLRFKIRYTRLFDETMFVRYYDEIYDIRSIKHVKRKDTYITAERGVE